MRTKAPVMAREESQAFDASAVVGDLGPVFADRAAAHDENDSFVADNYAELGERTVFSAGVPADLGGGGASHAELCKLLRELAHYCPSTALALSMHQHLVAATVWRYRHGQPGEAVLKKIAEKELVLVSTGAGDWLSSNGRADKVEGGFRVSAKKHFSSGCEAGNMLMTSAPYHDPDEGPLVLHFSVPLDAEGVSILENWRTLGMRATGSHTVVFEDAFVPEEAITLRRPQGKWHPVFNVILTVAMPLIMSVYVGTAEAAAKLARQQAADKKDVPEVPYLLGELENALVTAQMALASMIGTANNYDFEATTEHANAILICKTIAANAALKTTEKALEITGGAGYFRGLGLERLLRDVHAGQFHPLPEKRQQLFTGRLALGLEPVP